jgi:hypothetical protein
LPQKLQRSRFSCSAAIGGKASGPAAICSECLALCDEIAAEKLT